MYRNDNWQKYCLKAGPTRHDVATWCPENKYEYTEVKAKH